jgi:outer membrane protein assembly factor BamB
MNARSLSFAALFALVSSSPVPAQEWSRFHGPNGTGVSDARDLPARPSDADVLWKVELPGAGHASPILWGDRIFLMSTDPEKKGGIIVHAHRAADGKLLWKRDYALPASHRHKFNSYASATPAADAERVYVLWDDPEHYILTALTHDGQQVWQRDFGPFISQHGCGTSPMVYDGKVFLGNEQESKEQTRGPVDGVSSILAVDAKTGETVWQTSRKTSTTAYSTPCVYTPKDGKPQLLFNSQSHGIYGVDPDTGKVLWQYEAAFDKRSCSSPLIAGDLIFGSCGSGGGGNYVVAVKPGDPAKQTDATLAYEMKKSAPYVPTGIVKDDLVWLWSDGGILTCLHAPTGEVRYQERVGGNYFGSPVWVEGRLYCVSTAGELVVVEASDQFKVLHRFPLNELCHTTPAIAVGRMFIRTERHLWSFGGKRDTASQ